MKIILTESQLKAIVIEQSITPEQIRNEWSKVNLDTDTTTRGFGEMTSPSERMARIQAQMNARLIVAKKANHIKPSDTRPWRGTVGTSVVDEKTFQLGDGRVTYMCLMDKN